MNRLGSKAWLAFWVGMFLCMLLHLVLPRQWPEGTQAMDFRMRYNEAECVRSGKDPYLVWNGTLESCKYTPWDFKYLTAADGLDLIHAYPPWEYAWMLPFTFMPRNVAEIVFRVLSWCGLSFMVVCAFVLGYRARLAVWSGLAAASSVLLVWYPMLSCLHFLNYGVLIATAVLMAMLCHNKRRDLLAGMFWAFTLVKPQLGGLFMVVLLVRGKWRTLVVAGLITLLGTCVVACLCQRSAIEMILSITHYSKGQFTSTGFIPMRMFADLEPILGESTLMLGSAVLGVLLCVGLSWILLPVDNVFEWALPPVFLSTLWIAARAHDQTINAILILGVSMSAVKRSQVIPLVCDMLLILLVLSRDLDDMLHIPVCFTQILALSLLFVRAIKLRLELKGSGYEAIRCHSCL